MTIVADAPVATQSIAASLTTIEAELNATLIERSEIIRLALVATVARQHMLILGPPGSSKSDLIKKIAGHVAAPGGGGLDYFVYLMTKATTPNELFGPFSVSQMRDADQFVRVTTHKLPEAQLAFLDEVFKANSASLNSLLTILNEREFDNGPVRQTVPLISLFGASNEMPQGDDLGALWDRFMIRTIVGYVSDSGFAQLLRLSGVVAPPTTITAADLFAAQRAATAVDIPDDTIGQVEQLRRDLGSLGIVPSDRRWVQSLGILRANAFIDGRAQVDEDDLSLLADVLWQTPDQRATIKTAVGKIANPLNARAIELGDQAHSVYETFQSVANDKTATDEQKAAKAIEALGKLKKINGDLGKIKAEAKAQGGRVASRFDKVVKEVAQWQMELLTLATGA